jgi:hypothetical protein
VSAIFCSKKFHRKLSYKHQPPTTKQVHLINFKTPENHKYRNGRFVPSSPLSNPNLPPITNLTGLLGNLTHALDNTLTGGDKEKGQGGLLGSVTGIVGKTVDGLGNVVGQATDGVGNAVGQTTKGLGDTLGKTTEGVGNIVGGATNTASGLVGGQQQPQQKNI